MTRRVHVPMPWVLLASIAIGALVALYTLGRLMFPDGPLSSLVLRIIAVSAIGGSCVGGLNGTLGRHENGMKNAAAAAAPDFAFGALLIPKILQGFWAGTAVWWAGAATVFLLGVGVSSLTQRLMGRPMGQARRPP